MSKAQAFEQLASEQFFRPIEAAYTYAPPAPEPDAGALMASLLAMPSQVKIPKSRSKPKPKIRVCHCRDMRCGIGPFIEIDG